MKLSKTTIGILFASGTSFCWSILAIALKYSLDFIDSGSIVWVRMMTAFVCLALFFSFKKSNDLKILIHLPWLAVICAVCLAVNYFAYMKGLELTGASNTQIMIQTAPLLLTMIGILYFKETLSLVQWVGFLIAVCGFGLFFWDQILNTTNNAELYFQGNLWIFFSAVVWAIFAALHKQLSTKWHPQQLNVLVYFISAITLFQLADFNALQNLSVLQWCMMITLGLNTLIAYGCLAEALKRAPATYVSLIIAVNPLLTIFLMQLLAFYQVDFIEHEHLDWRGYLGALLIVGGVILVLLLKNNNHRPLNKKTSEPIAS